MTDNKDIPPTNENQQIKINKDYDDYNSSTNPYYNYPHLDTNRLIYQATFNNINNNNLKQQPSNVYFFNLV
jgi:hypothetical protein